jgi:hypothetical protein
MTLTAAAVSQTSRGTISGTVTDPGGAVLPNATITITEKSTGVTRETKTNSAGLYRFDAVSLGDYTVKVKNEGFAEAETAVSVSANQVSERDFQLKVSGSTESVTVEATTAQLQTEEPLRGGNIEAQSLANLPIVAQNSLNLILTLPGVVKSKLNGSLDSGIGSVNGSRARSNNFMIDGTDNNDISVAGPAYTITNNDAIQELAVQTDNFSSEFGRSNGAIVNQITKSGTNSLHGTVAEVYRTELFNASDRTQRNAFFAAQAAGQTVPLRSKFKENIPAFTIGGPVYIPHLYDGRSKTFFFAAGQWDRFSSGGQQQTFILPTDTGVANLQALSATCPNVALYLGIIGAERGSATSGASNIDISLPNQVASSSCGGGARTGQTVQVGQFVRTVPQLSLDNNHLIRVDHIASEKQNLTFRWLYDNQTQTAQNIGLIPAFDSNFQGRTMNAAFNDTYVISNAWTNEFRFSYERFNFSFPLADTKGLGNTLPEFNIGGTGLGAPTGIVSNLGVSATFPQGRVANSFQYQDAMSKIVGRHSFRFGGAILRQLAVQVAPFNGRGQIAFAPSTSNAFTGGTISALANFIDNFSGPEGGVASILFGSGKYRPNLFTWSLFFQDNWKATQNLTLNAGLRYENFGQPANIFKFPAFTGFADSNVNDGQRVNQDNNNFGPSLGFAYSPKWDKGLFGFLSGNGKAVLRGGYQVSYDTFYNNLLSNIAGASPNALSNLTITGVSAAGTPRGVFGASNIIPTLTPVPITPLTSINSVFSQNIRNPYTNRISLGVQRETVGQTLVEVSYVGALSRQLFYTDPLNPNLPNSTFTATGARLFPNRGPIQIRTSGANANYNAMQVSVRKPLLDTFLGEIGFASNYTWSRNMDILTETFGTNSSPQNPSRSPLLANVNSLDYGPSDNDRRHIWVSTLQWNIRGPKQSFLRQIFGGWSVAPIITLQSGTPYTPINGLDRDFDGSMLGDRPDVGNWNAPVNSRAVPVALTTCATGLRNPDTSTCVTANDVRWIAVAGYNPPSALTARRNSVYTTGLVNVDANILKTFRLSERWKFEYRAEIFNLTNTENFNTPVAGKINVNSTAPGQFDNFSLLSGLNTGNRLVRMGLKLIF